MKKILIFLGIIFLALFIFASFAQGQECVLLYQSCDVENVCCNFPEILCQGGYCKEQTLTCGELHTPCCDEPNPNCISGLVCQGGYCESPTTSTPTPSCGMPFQNCCPTEPRCVSPYGESIMICQGNSCVPESTACGSLGQPCCEGEPQCTTTNTECREGYCRSMLLPTPTPTGEDASTVGSIETAIGPIDVSSPEAFVNKILTFALGIGGGIAILLIIIGGVQVLTSAGNPEKAKAGKELITSAVSGLLLIVFAVFLLKLIGKDILKIPDFEP